jgi:hypothetical protein
MSKAAAKTTGQPKATGKAAKIREELAQVQIFARTGRLPIESPWDEPIAPGLPPKRHPGVVLIFDDGVCTLDPVRDAATIKKVRAWLDEGTDSRILQLGVMEVAPDAITPPFAKWDAINEGRCIETVDELGLDVEKCLRYELGKGEDARPKLIKALEAKIDEPAVEDDTADPVLD